PDLLAARGSATTSDQHSTVAERCGRWQVAILERARRNGPVIGGRVIEVRFLALPGRKDSSVDQSGRGLRIPRSRAGVRPPVGGRVIKFAPAVAKSRAPGEKDRAVREQ